ncbi:MAG TPA: cyclic nucleotide-binding domain-containing protein [Deltaproteobacteria bacterium]|jgi:CRP-like cAMP-binding protein|nr:cyclic nucleotide-binding domain-containing protein [Deltaproteobacteria bacterium]HPJ07028.1 cyclic nucleotide-binding domain-containing protein [Deltaproteobacteria bacterium]
MFKFALPDAERALMLDARPIESVEVLEYKQGEIIVREGEPSRYFYAILQGEVQIYQMDKPIRILTDQDVFGLENYYRGIPYTTTAKATRTSRIATYEADLIDEIAYGKPALASMIMRSAFLQLEQTTSIAEANIPYSETINLDIREYGDKELILEEGTSGTDIYKLYQTEGGLEVLKKGVRIGVITKPGEYFGEMSFILNEPRSATIRSIGKSMVEVIPVQDGRFDRIINENPEVANKIITSLAERLKQANLLIVK